MIYAAIAISTVAIGAAVMWRRRAMQSLERAEDFSGHIKSLQAQVESLQQEQHRLKDRLEASTERLSLYRQAKCLDEQMDNAIAALKNVIERQEADLRTVREKAARLETRLNTRRVSK